MSANVDFERVLGAWLQAAGPAAPDSSVIDGALDEARTTRRRRGLPSLLLGPEPWPAAPRTFGPIRLPSPRVLVVAALIVALVAAAALAGNVLRTPTERPTPPSPPPQAIAATPSPDAVTGPADDLLRAAWLADSSGIPQLGTGSGPVDLSISPDGTILSMDNFAPGAAFLSSVGRLAADRIQVELIADSGGCSEGDTGTYDWRLSEDRSEVTFDPVVETCPTRAVALGRTWVRSLAEPNAVGAGVVDTMTPDFFIRLPDDTYEARVLDDFIEIGGSKGFGILIFKDLQGFVDPCSTQEERYPYTPGAQALVEFFQQNDAWTILQSEHLEIDGHPAIHLVTRAKPDYARCPGQELYMYTPKACVCHFIAGPGGRDSHYLVEVGDDTFAFVLPNDLDAATEAAIVASIRIPEALPAK